MASEDPKEIKALGRAVRNFDGKQWDEVKYSLVLTGNYNKFSQNKALRGFLLSTGDRLLVEASPSDRIWGIGLSADDSRIHDPAQWRGENLLGFALMEVRDEIRRTYPEVVEPTFGGVSSDPTKLPATSHVIMVKDLANAVNNDTKPMITPREGRTAVDFILDIYKSSKENKEIVY